MKGKVGYITAAGALLFIMLFFPISLLAARSSTLSGSHLLPAELSGTVVNCMLEDSTGFLWFGTQTGLYRYDGYVLKPYDLHSQPANTFTANFITSISEDNEKNLWLGTFGGGLFKLNPQTGKYVNYRHDSQKADSLSDNMIRALYRDRSGNLWIGTQNKGLDRFDPVTGRFIHIAGLTAEAGAITAICQDEAGRLWVGTAGAGLHRLDASSDRSPALAKEAAFPGDDGIVALYLDKMGVLWIADANGQLNRLDTASGKRINRDFPELRGLRVNEVCEDSSGVLWIGTYGQGVRLLDRDQGVFTVRDDGLSADGSGGYRVVSLYGDSSGNLWIGTEGSGLTKINTGLSFQSYRSQMNAGLPFSDDVILSIYKDRAGVIWLGTANGGVNRFDRTGNRVTVYKNDPHDQTSISSNAVSSILEDRRGTLWFGTIDGVLNRFDPGTGKFERFRPASGEASSDNGILRIYEDTAGMMWICAANGGVISFDRQRGKFTQFLNDPNPGSKHVFTMAEDQSGLLWMGTGGGLQKLDRSTGDFTAYPIREPRGSQPTFDYSVNALVDDGGTIWLATDRGLYKFDKTSGRAVFMDDEQNSANMVIFGALKDEQGNLWLSTVNGLTRYDIGANIFKKYDFYGGLQPNKYNPGAYYQSVDGELFFGGINGFSSFYPERIKDNTHRPPVIITDFKIFDTSVDLRDTNKIRIGYRDNFIFFEFAALDYANPEKNQYAYKLEGFDQDWHYSGSRRYASYTNLDGGEYTLRIKAANNDGLWNEQGTRIQLTVIPPFWETSWFMVSTGILGLVALILLIKLRTRSANLRSRELECQVAERTRELHEANAQLRRADELKSNFLSMVSHEVRTPLSAILGFTELIADKIEKTILPSVDRQDEKTQKAAVKISRDLNIIMSEGDRLAALVNNLLNLAKIESGETEWKNEILDYSTLIEQALAITGPAIEKAGLEVVVDIEADLPKVFGDQDMLAQVLINLLANAVKFTGAGSIKIGVRKCADEVWLSVEDTGMGIPEADLGRIFARFFKSENQGGKDRNPGMGLGLYICQQIIERHGGRIWAASQWGRGSTFYVALPALTADPGDP